jgi:hypothetical protein
MGGNQGDIDTEKLQQIPTVSRLTRPNGRRPDSPSEESHFVSDFLLGQRREQAELGGPWAICHFDVRVDR